MTTKVEPWIPVFVGMTAKEKIPGFFDVKVIVTQSLRGNDEDGKKVRGWQESSGMTAKERHRFIDGKDIVTQSLRGNDGKSLG